MLKITSNNEILIDNKATGLCISQTASGTVVYSPEKPGQRYQAHPMPFKRYSAAHDAPRRAGQEYNPNVTAGRAQLEADVKSVLAKSKGRDIPGLSFGGHCLSTRPC